MQLLQGSQGNVADVMRRAEQEKSNQDAELQERLRRRRQQNEDRLKAKRAEMEDELQNIDIEHVVEQEKAAEAAQEMLEQEKQSKQQQ